MQKASLLLIGLLLGTARTLSASAGTEAASFLDIPVGAAPAALGSAYSAVATDAYAPVWNPAGLGFLPSTQIAAQHLSYLESINSEFVSVVLPLRNSRRETFAGVGLSAQYLGSGNITGSTLDGSAAPDYSSHYGAYTVAYGHRLSEKLSLGGAAKWIHAEISDVSADAFAADLSILYKANERLTLAGTVNNLGTAMKFLDDADPLPLAAHLSLAYEFRRRIRMMVEGVYFKAGDASGRAGLEWRPLDLLSLRAGYRTEVTRELGGTAGLSAGFGVHLWDHEFSYAWVPYGELGSTQYFSLVLRFGKTSNDDGSVLMSRASPKPQRSDDYLSAERKELADLLEEGTTR